MIGLVDEVENRRAKIIKRLHTRLEAGLIAEVKALLAHGVSAEQLTFYGLEYKFVTAYVKGEMNYNTLVERLSIAICQFAKRQQTFFRKMEKDGVKIQWLPAQEELSFLESASMKLIDQQFHLK
ncbi:tRNA dimethylallyltransferase [compost metagenome]